MQLKLLHVRQQQPADCLVACAAMVLAYLHIPISYTRVRQILGTTAEGTPFYRLDRLQTGGVRITRGEGTFTLLTAYLASDLPVIVDVHTAELPYWQMRTDIPQIEKTTAHAVVVVGIENQTVYVHDPDTEQAPHAVNIGDFELAWLSRDYRYVVIQH
jgi:ABC-type bacteriocin/lantibiotic exporter with double-glycine peptidase domain